MFELALGVSRKNANILKTLWGTRKEMEKNIAFYLFTSESSPHWSPLGV